MNPSWDLCNRARNTCKLLKDAGHPAVCFVGAHTDNDQSSHEVCFPTAVDTDSAGLSSVGRFLHNPAAGFYGAGPGLDVPDSAYFPPAVHFASGGILAKAAQVPGVIDIRDACAAMARQNADLRPDTVYRFHLSADSG